MDTLAPQCSMQRPRGTCAKDEIGQMFERSPTLDDNLIEDSSAPLLDAGRSVVTGSHLALEAFHQNHWGSSVTSYTTRPHSASLVQD